MKLGAEIKTLYNLVFSPKYTDHETWLGNFYRHQAADYDRFRKRLLAGRTELFQNIPFDERSVWVDLGGGTGSNLENLPSGRFPHKAYVVDLCEPLLAIADKRKDQWHERNVKIIKADAVEFQPEEKQVDVVTMSYALTMMPQWYKVLENVRRMLKPGGYIGVVDFYVSSKHTSGIKHGWFKRNFWPMWFEQDNVFLSPHHLDYLKHHFEQTQCTENENGVPYIPLLKVPYYTFIGRKG